MLLSTAYGTGGRWLDQTRIYFSLLTFYIKVMKPSDEISLSAPYLHMIYIPFWKHKESKTVLGAAGKTSLYHRGILET